MSGSGADWSPWALSPGTAGVITDYDGTLAPIVEDHRRAYPFPGTREVVLALASRLALVAVVSGRPLSYLDGQLGRVPGLVLVGLYGLEREKDGRQSQLPAALAWREAIDAAARDAEREAPEGLEVELKGLTFSLHARRRPEALDWATKWADERAAAGGLRVQRGRLSVELLPPVATDKGTVVEELSSGLDAVCFFGDDIGDLPAFAAQRRLRSTGMCTVAVGVKSTEQPEELAMAVDLLVDGPPQAVQLLAALAGGAPGAQPGTE